MERLHNVVRVRVRAPYATPDAVFSARVVGPSTLQVTFPLRPRPRCGRRASVGYTLLSSESMMSRARQQSPAR